MMGEMAKIQLPADQMPLLLENREKILAEFGKNYRGVLLDLEARG